MRICCLHVGGEKYEENLAKNDDENEDHVDRKDLETEEGEKRLEEFEHSAAAKFRGTA